MNKNILSNAIMFAAGAAIGSVVTWRLLKTKYENLVQEEIESIRQVYSGPQDSSEVDEESGEDEEDRRVALRYRRCLFGDSCGGCRK